MLCTLLTDPKYNCIESFASDWIRIDTDWCQLPTKRGKHYWYNKRTAKTQWERPPAVNSYLAKRFAEADIDRAGQLKFPVFRRLLKDDPLDLNYNHIDKLQEMFQAESALFVSTSTLQVTPLGIGQRRHSGRHVP